MLKEIFTTVWESVNKCNFPFEVIENIEFYRNNDLYEEEFADCFVNALTKNNIIIPIKLVNVDVKSSMKFYNYCDKLNSVVNDKLCDKLNRNVNISLSIKSLSNSEHSIDIENDYNIKLPDSDSIILHLHSSDALVTKSILKHFDKYFTLKDTYLDVQKSIIKSNSEYHKLINDKNKITNTLSRLESNLSQIKNNIINIESSILSDSIISSAFNDFTHEKTRCFRNIFEDNSLNPVNKTTNKIQKFKVKTNNNPIPTITTSDLYFDSTNVGTGGSYTLNSQDVMNYINSINYDNSQPQSPEDLN